MTFSFCDTAEPRCIVFLRSDANEVRLERPIEHFTGLDAAAGGQGWQGILSGSPLAAGHTPGIGAAPVKCLAGQAGYPG